MENGYLLIIDERDELSNNCSENDCTDIGG